MCHTPPTELSPGSQAKGQGLLIIGRPYTVFFCKTESSVSKCLCLFKMEKKKADGQFVFFQGKGKVIHIEQELIASHWANSFTGKTSHFPFYR